MAPKRLLDREEDREKGADKRPRVPSFVSTLAQAMRMESLQALLEPLLRRVVSEEIERVITNRIPANLRPSTRQIQGPGSRKLRLQFLNKLLLPLFTGSRIEGEQGSNVQIILIDTTTQQKVTSGPETSQKVEIVVLEGDFGNDDEDEWTAEEFENCVVRERDGKRPLLTGDLVVPMKDGLATLGELSFTDNSSWIRSRKFRLGARVTGANHDEIRIMEAKTEAFVVKDHRGELYKKHYPPALHDEVWRLDRIGKEGAFHKKLSSERINTVMDFLRALNRDHQHLRQLLGTGMSAKMWDGTVEHARTCPLNNNTQYVYNPPHQNNVSVIFNVVYTPVAINWTDGRLIAWNSISEAEKHLVERLVKSAYQHWPNGVRELADGLLMNTTSQLLALQHTPIQVLEGRGNSGYQGVALLSQQDEQAAQLGVKSEMVGRQQPMNASNDWLQPSESINMVDSNEVAIVSGFTHQGVSSSYTLPYQQANLSSHIYRNSHRNEYPDIMKNDWANQANEGPGGFYHSNSSNDLVNRSPESEDIQNMFRFYGGGTAEQGYNFFPSTPGDPMFNFANLSPTANFSFNMSGDRLHGKAYMGWLKLKAALKWGISVRKVVAARKAKVEELED